MRQPVWLLFAVVAAIALPVPDVDARESTIGGGSNIPHGAVVSMPPGTSLPPINHIFAANPGRDDMDVEFRAQTPPGIDIDPDRSEFTVAPGASEKASFAVNVAPIAPPGEHTVTVQLVRSDVRAIPGAVTNIPAVEVSFTVNVVGDTATVNVQSIGTESGLPVQGTLTLDAVDDTSTFEVARADGSKLVATVAPGIYEAVYRLGGRELARQQLQANAGDITHVVLEVDTVSFVTATAKPVTEGRKVMLVDLTTAVDNHLQPIQGSVIMQALVHRDGQQIDQVVIEERDGLALGVTEAHLPYRPPGGFTAGRYTFEFQLVTPEFTTSAPEHPQIDIVGGLPPYLTATAAAIALTLSAAWAVHRRRQDRPRRRARRPSGKHSAKRSFTRASHAGPIGP